MILRLTHLFILFLLVTRLYSQSFTIGLSENKPLKGFTEQQTPDGIFVEILNHIARQEKWELNYVSMNFNEGLTALEKEEIDIMPDLGKSDERCTKYKFNSEEVILTWGQVFCNQTSNIQSIIDLTDKKVAVVENDLFLLNPNDGFILLNEKFHLNVEFIYANNYSEVFRLIQENKADAGIANRFFGMYNLQNYNLKKTSIIFAPTPLHFAFPNNNKYDDIIRKIDEHLKKLKTEQNSVYYKLVENSFEINQVKTIPRNIKAALFILLALVLLTILFMYSLRKTVKLKTSELKTALEKAQESDNLKSAFLRNLSHEVRTPMNGINGFSLLLQDDQLEQKTRKRYTELVISSSQQLLSIVDNILAVSLIETKQEKINIFSVDINEILHDLFAIFSKSLDEKNVSFSIKKEFNGEDAIINTDGTKLRQILSNLVGNSVKFTSTGFINFGYKLKGSFLEFFVEDSGIGIDIKRKDQIFKLFSQEDNSNKRRYEGAGLGLSIAKGYTELLGGEIYFEFEKGVGTTFYFTIPYTPKND